MAVVGAVVWCSCKWLHHMERRAHTLVPRGTVLPLLLRRCCQVLAIAGTLSRGALPFVPVTPVETNALDLYRLTQFRLSTRIPVRGVVAVT